MPNNTQVDLLAGRLYDTYCKAVGGKAYDGKPLPPWEEFSKDDNKLTQANAWRAVAREASAAETGGVSAPCEKITTKKGIKVNPDEITSKVPVGIMEHFFVDVLRGVVKSPEILKRVADDGLEGSPTEIYRRINAGGHPVRDGLILLNNSLLTPKPKVGEKWFIPHPGTLQHVECTSFEDAMQQWFEGFNIPFLTIDGQPEEFKDSVERVTAYMRRKYPTI